MSDHTQIRWLVGTMAVCVISAVSGCATPLEANYVSNCTGQPADAALLIHVDANNNPTEVVDEATGKNADIIILCPDADVTWRLPGDREFTIKFKREAPFAWTNTYKKSTKVGNDHKLPTKIKQKGQVEYDGYKYTVKVKGSTIPLDPIIIVDR